MSEKKAEPIHVHVLTAPWGIGAYRLRNEDGTEEMGYGFYRPENPHDFFPDGESCRPEEIAAHQAAKDAWDAKQLLSSGKVP